MMHSHLGFFPENNGALRNENREGFEHDLAKLKTICHCEKSANILTNYCWSVLSEMHANCMNLPFLLSK